MVPWEFSPKNEVAFQHALQLAKAADNDILMIHIEPPKKMFESATKREARLQEAEEKLAKIASEHSEKHNITIKYGIEEGKLEKVFSNVIVSHEPNLIVTHPHMGGKNNESDITSLIKTTKKNSIPFILTENEPAHDHYIEVVIPIDYDKKFKETVRWVMNMSKYYKCNLNFIKPYYEDQEKKRLMANNIYFTKKMLDANEIIYGIKTAKKNKNFSDEIFSFGNKIDADLIVFMSNSYKRYVLNSNKDDKYKFEDKMKIPIMCINPMARKYQGFN
jgi:hypothetical protein